MTGHRIPELVFVSHFLSGSWNPSALRIYRWSKGTFANISETESACSHWIADPDHTGRYQVRTLKMVGGIEIGHSGLVHWPLIYDWNGTRYVAANARHPEEFRQARKDLLTTLKRHPDDPELWRYLGYSYLYIHRHRSAFAAFHQAERGYRAKFHEEEVPLYSCFEGWEGLGELAEVRGDRKEAVRCFRQVAHFCRAMAAEEKDAYVQQVRYDQAKAAVKRARHPHLGIDGAGEFRQ
ncbi:MAG: hypothetical protein JWN14_1378 [Chthonomonadales bacterium]|nr:hypothetical protein [Chthonomonadales bacterium]